MTSNMRNYLETLSRRYAGRYWERLQADISQRCEPGIELRDPPLVSDLLYDLVQAIFAKGAEVREAFAPLVSELEIEIEQTAAEDPRSAIPHLQVLNFASAVQSLGLEPSLRCIDISKHWLLSMETHRPEQFHLNYVRGFCALAFDEPRIYRPLAGFDLSETLPFTPRATFGFNLQALLAHFAAAAEQRAAFEAVRPAWLDLLANIDHLVDSEALAMDDLLLLARVVHHRIGRAPLASVAQWLHDEVWSFESEE